MKDKNSKNLKKNQLSNPHDVTFKKLFSKREIAADVIIKNLPFIMYPIAWTIQEKGIA